MGKTRTLEGRQKLCEMFEMRVNGATYEEIAEHFSVTKQYVQCTLVGIVDSGREFLKAGCIYPGLSNWMIRTGTRANTLNNKTLHIKFPTAFYRRMKGETLFTIDEIRKILDYTGLTFEEAFGEVVGIPGGDPNGCEQQAEGSAV